jgi:quinol-cytochrome oxidoreductase complex cytochrome b subunit/coenzyme F420-reducing hydrogenase delta subunit/NAD-dependent dihydropyrimidine dehydrogenase PreA subunit
MNAPELNLIEALKAEPAARRVPTELAAAPAQSRWPMVDLAYPLRHLGALTIYFFWVALVTGIYLFLFYETSVSGAWLSVERLTHEQWYFGGVMRSLHRYASDAAVITMIAHLSREFLRGRCRGPFWFSWISGVPLLWLVFIFGISGYWMVWDELAQFVATGTARLLDAMPIFTDPMIRSFLTNDAVSERFFTLIAFIHLVGLPILLVIAVWFHLMRVRLPRVNPPRALMVASFMLLLGVALVVPAVSHAPADLGRVPLLLHIDWFYLAMFPLEAATSPGLVWALVGSTTLLLAALPWVPPAATPPVAEVHLDNCSACGYCAEDCPYGAIDMVARSDGRHVAVQAQVDPSLCVGCGICVGACPSSSPLRRRRPLVSGIELPTLTVADLAARIDETTEARTGTAERQPPLVVFGCDQGVRVDGLRGPGVTTISLPCIGMLPTAFIDHALRGAAHGVVIAGCAECHYRYGDAWLGERLAGARNPKLRARVPRERLDVVWLGRGERVALQARIVAFRDRIASMRADGRGGRT